MQLYSRFLEGMFALSLTVLVAVSPTNAQGNPADVQECDSLTTASQASEVLSRLGISQPSDPNELVGTRCTQDPTTLCAAIPPETHLADFCVCCTTVIFTGTEAGAVGLNCTRVLT